MFSVLDIDVLLSIIVEIVVNWWGREGVISGCTVGPEYLYRRRPATTSSTKDIINFIQLVWIHFN